MSALIPDGLEPLAAWDCTDSSSTWWADGTLERIEWAKANVPRVNDTIRLDFYLLDAPFMVTYRIKSDVRGKLAQLPSGEPMLDPPVIVPLAELPPAHLLGPACGQCGRTGTAIRDVIGNSTLYSWPYDGAERYVCRGPCLETEG